MSENDDIENSAWQTAAQTARILTGAFSVAASIVLPRPAPCRPVTRPLKKPGVS
jgi:hypothetical protein